MQKMPESIELDPEIVRAVRGGSHAHYCRCALSPVRTADGEPIACHVELQLGDPWLRLYATRRQRGPCPMLDPVSPLLPICWLIRKAGIPQRFIQAVCVYDDRKEHKKGRANPTFAMYRILGNRIGAQEGVPLTSTEFALSPFVPTLEIT